MKNLTSINSKHNADIEQEEIVRHWGYSWEKLTPSQRKIVSEILDNLKKKWGGEVLKA